MSPAELADYALNRKPLFILDVRNASDYDNWKVEGAAVTSVNVPYFELLDGVETALQAIPQGEPVLVVCAKEGSSIFVAEQLAEAGVEAAYLQGGMKAWSEHLQPVKAGDLSGGGELYQFVRPGKGCLSYMIISGGEAAVIDPMRMSDAYVRFAAERGAVIRHTMDTHLHADHISGGRRLAEATGATYHLPPKDAQDVTFGYTPLEGGTSIPVGADKIGVEAVYSPGHTIGSTSFVVDGQYLLTGDILFVESIGRPDLAGSAVDWAGDLRATLYERYRALPGELTVLPAHYGSVSELGEGGLVSASLARLYRDNAGLRMTDEGEFRKAVTTDLPQQPNAYVEIRETNMGKLLPSDDEQREMEIGPNRCAIHEN
jgi:glyoxylase-like metal-dependent hydrolase (beta-lactamase superfamily II)